MTSSLQNTALELDKLLNIRAIFALNFALPGRRPGEKNNFLLSLFKVINMKRQRKL